MNKVLKAFFLGIIVFLLYQYSRVNLSFDPVYIISSLMLVTITTVALTIILIS